MKDDTLFNMVDVTTRAISTTYSLVKGRAEYAQQIASSDSEDTVKVALLMELISDIEHIISDCSATSIQHIREIRYTESA